MAPAQVCRRCGAITYQVLYGAGHIVIFRHNTLTGAQDLQVDGEQMHKVNFQYKLTGALMWTLDDANVELYVRSDGTLTTS
jgi:hypothetical protein